MTKRKKSETDQSAPETEAQVSSDLAADENTPAEETPDIEDAVIVEDEAPDEGEAEETPEAAPEDDAQDAAEEPEPEPEPEERSAPIAPPEPRRSGSGLMLLVGGLVAGGIGYGVETYLDGQQAGAAASVESRIMAQSDQIAALSDQIAAVPAAPDLTPALAQIEALSETVAGIEDRITTDLAALEDRLTDLEKRPLGDGTLSDAALAAYERELEALRAELTTQRDSVAAMASQAEADLAAARAEAEAQEAEAARVAERAAGRAAINRIAAAIETGSAFDDVLPDLAAVVGEVPADLSAVAGEGVAPLSILRDEFADAARAAMSVARAEGLADEGGGLGAFLRSQFDVRSTTPREGDDPDAVLSRVQGAMVDGRVQDALAELDGLPEVVRAEISDWVAKAEARVDAQNALADLSAQLNEN